MTETMLSAYYCHTCEVEARDPELEPECWLCGGPVLVTSRFDATKSLGPMWHTRTVTPTCAQRSGPPW